MWRHNCSPESLANRARKGTAEHANRDKRALRRELSPEPSVSGSLPQSRSPKTPRNRVFFRVDWCCAVKVSAAADSMAERVGFEPTVPLQVHLISNQARSTELRHLSEGAQASNLGRILGYPASDELRILRGRPEGPNSCRVGPWWAPIIDSEVHSPLSDPRASLRPL